MVKVVSSVQKVPERSMCGTQD